MDRKNNLKDYDEWIKFLKDILNGLTSLQFKNKIHGNIMPQYIFYDQEHKQYFIADWLNAVKHGVDYHLRSINKHLSIYLSPHLFENGIDSE